MDGQGAECEFQVIFPREFVRVIRGDGFQVIGKRADAGGGIQVDFHFLGDVRFSGSRPGGVFRQDF